MTQRDFLGSAATRAPAGASSPGSAQELLGAQAGARLPAQHPVHPGRRTALSLGLPSRRERCRRVPASLHAKRAFAVAARRQIRQALHRCLGLHTIARRADHRALQPAELVDADPHEQSGPARRSRHRSTRPTRPMGSFSAGPAIGPPISGNGMSPSTSGRGWSRMASKGSSPRTRSASICRAPSDRSPTIRTTRTFRTRPSNG